METLAQYRAWRKEGRWTEALPLARRLVIGLDPAGVNQLGQWLGKDLAAAGLPTPAVSVRLIGQCTTTFLRPLLTAWAWAEGIALAVTEAGYDQMVQDVQALADRPDIIVLLPWHQRLLAPDARPPADRVGDELGLLRAAWTEVSRLKAKLVQVGYDWTGPGPLGYALSARRGGEMALIGQANAAVQAALPAGTFFVDLAAVSAWHGKSRFYDGRNYLWLKQPFSPEGLSALARHLASGIRALTTGRRKVLVLDLDHTLWGGVVGEVGPHGIAIGGTGDGEGYLAFQRFVRQLRDSGVLLAVCSKNNEADAREPFVANDQMALRLADFAAFHAAWDPKPGRVRQIAEELNLGLESFVFFDDNPAERARMRAELPEVTVVEVPADPADYVRALQESLAFEAVELTAADAERAAQYAAEASRRQAQGLSASPGDYLASLAMTAEVVPIGPATLDRVVDLVTKTNQFNLTTRRHSRAAIDAMVATPGSVCFAVRLADKFGDYGLVAVVLALPTTPTALHLDTWLMSCRAMGRRVEHFTLNHLVATARAAGRTRLTADYLPTAKNEPVRSLLPDGGFLPRPGHPTGWTLDLVTFTPMDTAVTAPADGPDVTRQTPSP